MDTPSSKNDGFPFFGEGAGDEDLFSGVLPTGSSFTECYAITVSGFLERIERIFPARLLADITVVFFPKGVFT
jgi:hypothetical protein